MNETLTVGLLTFLFGLLLGHRMNLWREKRKEFNEVATRILVALKSRQRSPQPYFTTEEKISGKDMETFQHLLHPWKRSSFKAAWAAYQAECDDLTRDSVGQAFYSRPDAVGKALDKLIRYSGLR